MSKLKAVAKTIKVLLFYPPLIHLNIWWGGVVSYLCVLVKKKHFENQKCILKQITTSIYTRLKYITLNMYGAMSNR
jgi:hypothetical protein